MSDQKKQALKLAIAGFSSIDMADAGILAGEFRPRDR